MTKIPTQLSSVFESDNIQFVPRDVTFMIGVFSDHAAAAVIGWQPVPLGESA